MRSYQFTFTIVSRHVFVLLLLSFGCVDLTPPWQLTIDGGQRSFGGDSGPSKGQSPLRGDAGLADRWGGQGTDSAGSSPQGSGGTTGSCINPDAQATSDGSRTGFGGSKAAPADGGDGGGLWGDAGVDGPGCSCRQCDGVTDSSICWRLGRLGATCASTCADRGGTSLAAHSHVGTNAEGGSPGECQRLLGLFGIMSSVATVSINAGLGCHMKMGVLWPFGWASSPAYSENASSADVRILCGCLL